eukprot:scaffold90866_cov61-Phaeocystis_antarctica.AAC.5
MHDEARRGTLQAAATNDGTLGSRQSARRWDSPALPSPRRRGGGCRSSLTEVYGWSWRRARRLRGRRGGRSAPSTGAGKRSRVSEGSVACHYDYDGHRSPTDVNVVYRRGRYLAACGGELQFAYSLRPTLGSLPRAKSSVSTPAPSRYSDMAYMPLLLYTTPSLCGACENMLNTTRGLVLGSRSDLGPASAVSAED